MRVSRKMNLVFRFKAETIVQARQLDREFYFKEQSYTTEKFVFPYISVLMPITSDIKIAEIGCGEGGNLKPFLERGCSVVGIDLSDCKISNAVKFFENHPLKRNLKLINKDIYEIQEDTNLKFDLIIMRDTLEHIHNQYLFLEHLKKFLKPNGKVFIAFPAWRMPFGGHQQMCHNKFLSHLPYYHIFPIVLYRLILKLFCESQRSIDGLMEIKETRISIQKFQRIVRKRNYKIEKQTNYLINPNYEVKFKLKPRKLPIVLNIPYFRDFFVTTLYSVISLKV
ncbi:MAG: class I SAM-dependent methyltransferase [Salinivirgaceae bacterium]|nr:class I SAM-dependent methyltransferase [Salinivirgaceae bacterium]